MTGTLAIVAGNFIFRADSPVCMRGNEAEDNLKKIAKVHLYTNSDRVRRQLGRLRGQYFEVVGRPFPAHTIHHKAPIVMEVAEIVRI